MSRHSCFAWIVAAGAVAFPALPGCQTAQKVTGTRFAHFSADPDQVVEAAKEALDELDLQMISSAATKLDGQIEAKTAQGKTVSITVEKEGEGVSKVGVKVGTFGDETISNAVIEKTRARLEK